MITCVDVFVPCYNYGRFLAQSVQSVLAQQDARVRVLILDDASSDETPTVSARLMAADTRVAYRRHQRNLGHIATYNEGIEWVTGEYMLLLSADDLLAPGALGRATRVFDSHPNVGLVHGRALRSLESPVTTSAELKYYITRGADWLERICERASNVVETPTAVVRTSIQKKIGGYRPELPHSGDLAMWLCCAAHSDVAFIDADQAFYRVHGTNMSERYRGIEDVLQRKMAFDLLFQQERGHLRDCERLRRMAYRRLAQRMFLVANDCFDAGSTADCEHAIQIVVELNPQVVHTAAYRRLQWKRRLGPAIAGRIRRLRSQIASRLSGPRATTSLS